MAGQERLISVEYFLFDENGKYLQVNNKDRNQMFEGHHVFSLEIYHGTFHHGGYENDYLTFNFYQRSVKTDTLFLNGWKLKFRGPVQDAYHYNQYRVFQIYFISPDEVEHFINLGREKQVFIYKDDITRIYQMFKFYSDYENFELAEVNWKLKVLQAEYDELKIKCASIKG